MSVKINSFGGPIVWFLRKYCSGFTSKIMLKAMAKKYSRISMEYIEWFLAQQEIPLFFNVMIETINRCNGKCEFCPANVDAEDRPLKRMESDTFYKIIEQLNLIGWSGKLFMCVNNEPFIDKRIIDFSKYAKEHIRGVQIAMITNGTMLTPDKLDAVVGVVDQITINDYSERYSLSDIHKNIYRHIKNNSDRFSNMKICINRRYAKEILATRAGLAPNKPKSNVNIRCTCLYPFTDLVIFPDGQVGMCCNDCKEVTHFGNIANDSIYNIWINEKFRKLRFLMQGGQRSHPFCQECDVIDAGERERYIRKFLKR